VAYEGFLPECVRVTARDVASGKELSQEVEGKGERTGGSLVVGVLPPDDWGSTVEVSAQAYERACSDPQPVVSNSERVTLTRGQATPATLRLLARDEDQDGYVAVLSGGTDCRDDQPAINPGATERCNDADDNCNGQPDAVELRLGQSCTATQSCSGTFRCGNGGEVVCSVTNAILAYPDVDQDGRGDRNASPTSFCNGVPAGYVTSPADDCDDTRPSVRPGLPERCNDLDDNCDGNLNEGFPAPNTVCTDAATQCAGLSACDSVSGTSICQLTQTPQNWVMDADGDGFGSGAAIQSCVSPGSGYVTQGGDCNDGNRFTFPGATEICDQEDNNCDGQPEAASVCPAGGPTWRERIEGSGSQIWHSASTWAPGGVWVVGENNYRAVLTPGSTTFQVTQSSTGGCGSSGTAWYSVWADPEANGRAWFGSAGGRLANQTTGTTACTQVRDTDLAVYGLVGLRTNGDLLIYGASDSATLGEGRAFTWNGIDAVNFNSSNNVIDPVYDVHGISRDILFLVGGFVSNPAPRVYRHEPGTGRWVSENVQSAVSGVGRLIGIWVVNARLAFAVGDAGSVVRWNGATWSRLAFPNTHNLTSVVAFGASSAYATCASGHIYQYNGQTWRQIHQVPNAQFNDIAGTSPADLWVVGDGGRILHWPD
jgi:hypothetical protein